MTATTTTTPKSSTSKKRPLANGRTGMDKMAHDAGEKIGSLASSITHTATDSPMKSMAIAAAVGLIAGGAIALAFSRKK